MRRDGGSTCTTRIGALGATARSSIASSGWLGASPRCEGSATGTSLRGASRGSGSSRARSGSSTSGSSGSGSEAYTEENGSYGLATIRRNHVRVRGDEVRFDFSAKGGQRRIQTIEDPALARLTGALVRRSGGGHELLAFRDGTSWRDVRSDDINAYLKDLAREDISAKDFRTWHATVLTAALLASQEEGLTSVTSRTRVVSSVVREVAEALGNTPAVCRASYIDPRMIDRFLNGETIALPRGRDLTDDRVRAAVETGRPRPPGAGRPPGVERRDGAIVQVLAPRSDTSGMATSA